MIIFYAEIGMIILRIIDKPSFKVNIMQERRPSYSKLY